MPRATTPTSSTHPDREALPHYVGERVRVTVNGRTVTVETTTDRDYALRVDVLDESDRWEFGVDVNGELYALARYDRGGGRDQRSDPTVPIWVERALKRAKTQLQEGR